MSARLYSPLELSRFRAVQKLAYECTTEVAAGLRPGVTETQAAQRLEARLRDHGVRSFFHQPFAWFGDRTTFTGFRTPLDFFPTDRELKAGAAAILDVAPIKQGYAADIGYAFSVGDNPVLDRALRDLREFRVLILERVNRGDTLGEVYRAVEDLLADLGYRNCHRKYPFAVLAHRIYRQPFPPLVNRRVLGFGVGTVAGLLSQFAISRVPPSLASRLSRLRQGTPFCNVAPGSDQRPEPGLWAFEPHIARGDVGAKWEEMLVVTDERAYWLDDDVPHVRAPPVRPAQMGT